MGPRAVWMFWRREEAVVPAWGRSPDRLAYFLGSIFYESVSLVLKYIFSPYLQYTLFLILLRRCSGCVFVLHSCSHLTAIVLLHLGRFCVLLYWSVFLYIAADYILIVRACRNSEYLLKYFQMIDHRFCRAKPWVWSPWYSMWDVWWTDVRPTGTVFPSTTHNFPLPVTVPPMIHIHPSFTVLTIGPLTPTVLRQNSTTFEKQKKKKIISKSSLHTIFSAL